MERDVALKERGDILQLFERANSILKKTYLSNLDSYSLERLEGESVPISQLAEKLNSSVRFFEAEQIVINKNENVRDKLTSVFNAVGNTKNSLLLQIKGEKERTFIRYGIKSHDGNVHSTTLGQNVLENSLLGNFPGTKMKRLKVTDLQKEIIDDFSAQKSVVTVTDIAGMRGEEESKDRQFMQGIEKLVDAMRGKTYTVLVIADPLDFSDLNAARRELEAIYSALVPYSSCNSTVGVNEAETISSSIAKGVSTTLNKSLAKSLSYTSGKNNTTTEGISHTSTDGTSSSFNTGGNFGFSLGLLSKGKNSSTTQGTSSSLSEGRSSSNAYGSSYSDTTGSTSTKGYSKGTSETVTDGSSRTMGSNYSLQIKEENHSVVRMMAYIEKMLNRYDGLADVGMWNCAAYCIADSVTAQMLASIYRSILRGKDSSLENGAITVWSAEKVPAIMDALRHFRHPRLMVQGFSLTPTTVVSSTELTFHAGLPHHSLPSPPVIECAEFGRAVTSYDENVSEKGEEKRVLLGHVYHMHTQEELEVKLDLNSLASHTFITGSTGSGKSNAVYQILRELQMQGIKFLVIEPAKGEYKHVFGTKEGVTVYGTNPAISPLLHLNPFRFLQGVHVLEHIDRLVELFNVCWPMYAAMPAVLKDAVECSYQDAGWDLVASINPKGELYHSFLDVCRNVNEIISASEYDADTKGAYKGALITRLKSLTNGLNRLIFVADSLSYEELFDKNVIVDLSRVGSSELKSLIMGLLVMQLQEYRMTHGRFNSELRHITVLEEAHNLLKRTSMEQASESANLLGKSVEMLSNAIAEMRTFGEGFIIADQSPSALDSSCIRNTNTKIVMRLPDFADRELVGKAASLNDGQVAELSKLALGVAAVYQNDWIEPVLCKISHVVPCEDKYSYRQEKNVSSAEDTDVKKRVTAYLLSEIAGEKVEEDIEKLKSEVRSLQVYARDKNEILDWLSGSHLPCEMSEVQRLITSLHLASLDQKQKGKDKLYMMLSEFDSREKVDCLNEAITELTYPNLDVYSDKLRAFVINGIINELATLNSEFKDIPSRWLEFMKRS